MALAEPTPQHSHNSADLPMGRAGACIPPAGESHPACWEDSDLISAAAGVQSGDFAHGLGRVPFKFWMTVQGTDGGAYDVTLVADETNVSWSKTGAGTVKFKLWAI